MPKLIETETNGARKTPRPRAGPPPPPGGVRDLLPANVKLPKGIPGNPAYPPKDKGGRGKPKVALKHPESGEPVKTGDEATEPRVPLLHDLRSLSVLGPRPYPPRVRLRRNIRNIGAVAPGSSPSPSEPGPRVSPSPRPAIRRGGGTTGRGVGSGGT